MSDPDFDSADDQDGAEALDETNLTEDGDDIANFDTMPDVYDVTSADGDEDDDEALALDADELDPDALDEDQIAEDELGGAVGDYETDIGAAGTTDQNDADEDAVDPGSIDGLNLVADADTVEGGEDDFTNFESRNVSDADLAFLGYAKAGKPSAESEARLDEGLEETFPASDPVSINPGSN